MSLKGLQDSFDKSLKCGGADGISFHMDHIFLNARNHFYHFSTTSRRRGRDPASYLHLRSDPPDVAGQRSGDMLSSRHWRIEPLESGAWDVILIPEGLVLAQMALKCH